MITEVIPQWQITHLKSMLRRVRNVVITCHLSPDGDAIGSSLAMCAMLRKTGKSAFVVLPDRLPQNLQFIAEEGIEPIVASCHPVRAASLFEHAQMVMCLDFNTLKRVDKLAPTVEACPAPRVLIDHHESPETEHFKLWLSYPEMSSTCELVYRIISQAGWEKKLDRYVARCLYLGIMTDTGNFVHNNSNNPELFEIAARLLQHDIDKGDLYNRAMNTFSANALRLQGHALSERMEIDEAAGAALITLSLDDLTRFNYQKGDTEGLVNMPLTIPGVRWSTYMREEERYVKISMRSREGFTVNDLCERYFNGGGHELAAGGDYYGPLADAIALYHTIVKNVGTQHVASEIPHVGTQHVASAPRSGVTKTDVTCHVPTNGRNVLRPYNNGEMPRRRSPRAYWAEYNEGNYFITVCTYNMIHYFGEIYNEKMHLTKIGEKLHEELTNASTNYKNIEIPLFVVMPNHFHAIIHVYSPEEEKSRPSIDERFENSLDKKNRPLLSTYISGLKASITKFAHESGINFSWQARFHDHIIRNLSELQPIADYINNNVNAWKHDRYCDDEETKVGTQHVASATAERCNNKDENNTKVGTRGVASLQQRTINKLI